MKLNKPFFLLCLIFIVSSFASSSFALPFIIVPKAGTSLPTAVAPPGIALAFYTVTNNTNSTRAGNFVKYLPPNVSHVSNGPGLCGPTFTLTARGTPGDSCTLQLIVSGPVNANDPNPHHHLFVCFPGGATCAGTRSPLNVSSVTSTLYGTSGEAGINNNFLFIIDKATAGVIPVMQLSSDDGAVIASNGSSLFHWTGFSPLKIFERINLQSLSLTPIPFGGSAISEVYGAVFFNNTFLVADINSNFYSFTPAGQVTLLGNTGIDIRGMACLHQRIYAIARNTANLHEINPVNGAILSTIPITLPGFVINRGLGLTVDPTTGQFYALVRVVGSQIRKLIKVNINTGAATLVGDLNDGTGTTFFASITFHPADPTCA